MSFNLPTKKYNFLVIGSETAIGIHAVIYLSTQKYSITALTLKKPDPQIANLIKQHTSHQFLKKLPSNLPNFNYIFLTGKYPLLSQKDRQRLKNYPGKIIAFNFNAENYPRFPRASQIHLFRSPFLYGPGLFPSSTPFLKQFFSKILRYQINVPRLKNLVLRPMFVDDAVRWVINYSLSTPSRFTYGLLESTITVKASVLVDKIKTTATSVINRSFKLVPVNKSLKITSTEPITVFNLPPQTTLESGLIQYLQWLFHKPQTKNQSKSLIATIFFRLGFISLIFALISLFFFSSLSNLRKNSSFLLSSIWHLNSLSVLINHRYPFLKPLSPIFNSLKHYPENLLTLNNQDQRLAILDQCLSKLKTTPSTYSCDLVSYRLLLEQTLTLPDSKNSNSQSLALYRQLSPEFEKLLTMSDYQLALVVTNTAEPKGYYGFIEGVIFINFKHGVFSHLTKKSVYSLDGELNGVVTPPDDLSTLLNETAWYLRDANWSPNPLLSASQIAWFIEKESGRVPNSLLFTSPYTLKSILTYLGPLNLKSGQIITAETLFSYLYPKSGNILEESLLLNIFEALGSTFFTSENNLSQYILSGFKQSLEQNTASWFSILPQITPLFPETNPSILTNTSSSLSVNLSLLDVAKYPQYPLKSINHQITVLDSGFQHQSLLTLSNPNPHSVRFYLRLQLPLKINDLIFSLNSSGSPVLPLNQIQLGHLQIIGLVISLPAYNDDVLSLTYFEPLLVSTSPSHLFTLYQQPGYPAPPTTISLLNRSSTSVSSYISPSNPFALSAIIASSP